MSDPGFVEHCLELLAPLGSARAHRMFGGHGLYIDDLCIALILRDTLYLKAGEAHRPTFEAAGCHPFTYSTRQGEVHVTSYWSAPEAAMESPPEMRPWARLALEAAVAARARKAPARKTTANKAAAPVPAKKTRAKKTEALKAEARKAEATKAEATRTEARKAEAKKADAKESEAMKPGAKEADARPPVRMKAPAARPRGKAGA
jgi:DNA transformation protein